MFNDDNNKLFMLIAIAVLVYLIISYNNSCENNEGFAQPINVTGVYPAAQNTVQAMQPIPQQTFVPPNKPSVTTRTQPVPYTDPTLLAQQQLINQQMQDQLVRQQQMQQLYTNGPAVNLTKPPLTQVQQQAPQQAQQAQQQAPQQVLRVPIVDEENFNPNDSLTFESQAPASSTNYLIDIDSRDPKFSNQKQPQKDRLSSNDLLPQTVATNNGKQWFDTPSVGVKIDDANLLSDAITRVGVDTVGQTRKNPSYDLRGTPPCPKFAIGPFNNSTIEPDINLKSLY